MRSKYYKILIYRGGERGIDQERERRGRGYRESWTRGLHYAGVADARVALHGDRGSHHGNAWIRK